MVGRTEITRHGSVTTPYPVCHTMLGQVKEEDLSQNMTGQYEGVIFDQTKGKTGNDIPVGRKLFICRDYLEIRRF